MWVGFKKYEKINNQTFLILIGKGTTENIASACILKLEKWVDNDSISFYTVKDVLKIYNGDLIVKGTKFICFIPK